jgi:phosphomannomutase
MTNEQINRVLECGFRYAKYKLCLARNRKKADSRSLSLLRLYYALHTEIKELDSEIRCLYCLYRDVKIECTRRSKKCTIKNIKKKIALEAADIINFAAMICDKTEEVEEWEIKV